MENLLADEVRREKSEAPGGKENPWAIRNPLDEARDLHRMMTYGSCTVESMRDLISVPAGIEAALLAYADRYPKEGRSIHRVLKFRRRVAEEFERLVQCDMSYAPLAPRNSELSPHPQQRYA